MGNQPDASAPEGKTVRSIRERAFFFRRARAFERTEKSSGGRMAGWLAQARDRVLDKLADTLGSGAERAESARPQRRSRRSSQILKGKAELRQ